jgi:hypothetical protein
MAKDFQGVVHASPNLFRYVIASLDKYCHSMSSASVLLDDRGGRI